MTPDGPGAARAWHAELAWLPGVGVLSDVLIEAAGDRFTVIAPRTRTAELPLGTIRLAGLTMPALANAHSHAFHRALRGITQAGRGTFWTWRERMYQVAERLDPDSYLALARAVYAEMTLAGIGCVGEFHYLHHGPDGVGYADPNAMGRALIEAAAQAGLRITLLDTCYLSGGLDPAGGSVPLAGQQLRFGDGTAQAWANRVSSLGADARGMLGPAARAGAAIHSVRAVPPDQMPTVAAWTHSCGAPLHVHLSEQITENDACLAAYRRTPAAVLYDAGALGPRTSVVHATHLTGADIRLLGGSEVFACVCPTTEADLADGIGPFGALAAAGCRLTVGSDSQAVIDLFEEARRIEMYERLASQERGHFTADELGTAVTWDGHASLGWPDAGEIAPGSLADLVTVGLDSPRLAGATGLAGAAALGGAAGLAASTGLAGATGLAGTEGHAGSEGHARATGLAPADGSGPDLAVLEAVIFAASPADVRNVVIGGRDVVVDGRHVLVDDVPAALSAAIHAVLG
ncbi:MAG TPA: formimidoylglutamate deiminase [Streptosporangiaceae bacterium]|nr:formimidoylglutamate deiminase [Streptosporangiaceae bacterium]